MTIPVLTLVQSSKNQKSKSIIQCPTIKAASLCSFCCSWLRQQLKKCRCPFVCLMKVYLEPPSSFAIRFHIKSSKIYSCFVLSSTNLFHQQNLQQMSDKINDETFHHISPLPSAPHGMAVTQKHYPLFSLFSYSKHGLPPLLGAAHIML